MWQTTFSFIESANRLDQAGDLSELLCASVKRLGFEHLVIGALTHPKNYGTESPALLNTMPQMWSEHYFKSNYEKIDPVIRNVAVQTLPFRWSAMPVENRQQQTILNEAKEAGLHDGITIPVHGANQDLFCISLGTDSSEAARAAPLDQLRLIAVHLQTSFLRLAQSEKAPPPPPPVLTQRERDCLSYCAIGKTSWEIGQILGISEKTVDFHIGNASIKLDANSRIFAVVKALRLGLIFP